MYTADLVSRNAAGCWLLIVSSRSGYSCLDWANCWDEVSAAWPGTKSESSGTCRAYRTARPAGCLSLRLLVWWWSDQKWSGGWVRGRCTVFLRGSLETIFHRANHCCWKAMRKSIKSIVCWLIEFGNQIVLEPLQQWTCLVFFSLQSRRPFLGYFAESLPFNRSHIIHFSSFLVHKL